VKIIYENKKAEKQCTNIKEATKLFGGNKTLALSLLSRIEALKSAEVINDIRVIKPFRFHNLVGNYKGYFAIDVKSKTDKWRLIIQPLDEDGNVFKPCNIDEIASIVRTVKVKEISSHYE